MPLFGGRRAIRVRAGSRNIVPAVEGVLAAPLRDCRVVIEAGDLKRNAALRMVCERAKGAVAIPCYADDERDLGRLIDKEMRAAGLTMRRMPAPHLYRCSAATAALRARAAQARCFTRTASGRSSSMT